MAATVMVMRYGPFTGIGQVLPQCGQTLRMSLRWLDS